MDKYLGAHVSASGGVEKSIDNALKIKAKAFAFFVKNQRQWNAKPLTDTNISKFKSGLTENGYSVKYILPHAGYLINLGNPFSEKREKSINSFIDELSRCNELGLECLNIHPGSHLREITEETCIDLIVDSLEQAFDAVPGIKIILENTAGQGSNMGYKFEHFAMIINKLKDKSRIGVCLDTCHTYAAGYDIKELPGFKDTMSKFEDLVGINYLMGIHLNDSKVKFASRKDRHESIGKGFLGLDFFKIFMNDARFNDMPIVLETIDDTIWKEEIELLYSMEQK
ncbi:MAG: deoxyribonuclease IV [bacterium]|nr:deoxyribonuclease IV [bacterium]